MKHQFPLKAQLAKRGMKLSEMAAALGVDKSAVTRWCQIRVPSERVLEVERFTGISRHELRADIFGPAPERSAAS